MSELRRQIGIRTAAALVVGEVIAVGIFLTPAGMAKSLGSPTHLNVAKATMNGLLGQRRPDEVARLRGKKAEDITPPGLLAAYNSTESLRAMPSEAK